MLARPLAQAVGSSTEIAQGESKLVRMRGRPSNDPFELRQIISNGTDFDQLCFDSLWISHGSQRFLGSPAVWSGVKVWGSLLALFPSASPLLTDLMLFSGFALGLPCCSFGSLGVL